MNRNGLLIGISAAAIVAGWAFAPATAQTRTGNCTPPADGTTGTSPGGTCRVDNRAAVNDTSSSFIFQAGESNFAHVVQPGDKNVSVINQNGVSNDAFHGQIDNHHYANTSQTGNDSFSIVKQRDQDNSATIAQVGNNHSSDLTQGGGFSDEDSDAAGGENNVASVTQNGDRLGATLVQARSTLEQGPADDNVMTVVMTGVRNAASVLQLSRGNVARSSLSGGVAAIGAPLNNNFSSIVQNTPFYRENANGQLEAPSGGDGAIPVPPPTNNPVSGNVADAAVTGERNTSRVQQNGVLNSATVSMLGGGAGNTGDTSIGTQVTNPENFGPSGRRLPANRKQGNDSRIDQTGRGNVAAVSLGGLGGQGNVSQITQGTATGDPRTLGINHTAFVWQRGTLDNSTVRQDNNLRGASGAVQSGSFADVSQRSLNSTSYVEQLGTNSATVSQALNGSGTGGDNSLRLRQQDAGDEVLQTGGIFPDPDAIIQQRNMTAISQSGIGNAIAVDQDARNATAIAWQQNRSARNSIEIEQGTGAQVANASSNNAQDGAAVGSAGGFLSTGVPADAGDTGSGARNLLADVTQSGHSSAARIRQDGQNLWALINQAGIPEGMGVIAIDTPNFAGISQINAWNSATVTQDGFSQSATVDQRGTGSSALPNLVTIQQTGDGNEALARQLAAVAPSAAGDPAAGPAPGDPAAPSFRFARAAGVNSAEIQIIQRGNAGGGNGNDAFVEQQGKGQFARIEQEGSNNNAGILQGPAAANAVAVIEQFGSGNDFFIEQTAAGQYQQIRQTGNDNVASNLIGGAGGGTGTTVAPGWFPF